MNGNLRKPKIGGYSTSCRLQKPLFLVVLDEVNTLLLLLNVKDLTKYLFLFFFFFFILAVLMQTAYFLLKFYWNCNILPLFPFITLFYHKYFFFFLRICVHIVVFFFTWHCTKNNDASKLLLFLQ